MGYGLFGAILAEPGKREELVGHLLQAAGLLEPHPGCIHYVVGTSEHPDAVWVSEAWTDQEAHDGALASDDIRALVQQAQLLIAGVTDQTHFTIKGGKGLPQELS